MGMLEILSNKQLAERESAAAFDPVRAAMEQQSMQLIGSLGGYIEQCWQAAYNAKQAHEREMLMDVRQRDMIYEPELLASIKQQGGSEIYMSLTNIKSRTAKSWVRDVMLPAGERPFGAEPTPVPELSPDVVETIVAMTLQEAQMAMDFGVPVTEQMVYERAQQRAQDAKDRIKIEADRRNARMEDKIADLMVQGAWYEAMESVINDLIDLPAGIMKCGVIRKERTLQWMQTPQGNWVPQATDELTPMFYAVSPFDFFPAPDSRDVNDGYLFEKIPTRRGSLYSMIGVPGYSEENIRAALEDYEKGFTLPLGGEQMRRDAEGANQWQNTPDKAIDVLEFHGSVKGAWLVEWGMDAARVPDPQKEYEVTAWKVGRFIVRCVLDEDPLGKRPYEMAYYDRQNGSFWGRGIPRIIRDLQGMCNAAARALSNNMGLSSGPLVEVEADRLAPGQSVTNIFPWMIYQTQAAKGSTPAPAIRFHTVPSVANELVNVYKYFSTLADQYSGIPSYEHGVNPTSGAAGTASGLSMLMNAASRQVKAVVASLDNITKGCVRRLYTHLMLHDPDQSIKGDIKFVARGTTALLVREQMQLRRAEFLTSTLNPIDMQIIGIDGRAEMLRAAAKGLDMPGLIPGKEALMAKMQQAMMQAIPPQPQGPANAATLDPAGAPAGGQAQNQFAKAA